MPLNDHNSIELVPTTTKVPVPFVVVQKRSRPDSRGGIKQVYFWRPSRPNENIAVAPATPFPRATLAKRVSTRERCGRGVQQSYSAAALNLL